MNVADDKKVATIKALIIDDEQKASDVLRLMIERFVPEIKQVQCCNDARKAAEVIHLFQPDIIFLDIRMPYLDGFGVLNQIQNKRFKVIFTTAYNEYTVQAIRFSAFDYLLKPVDATELINAVQRYQQALDELSFQPEQLKNILHNIDAASPGEFRLALPSREGVYFIRPDEILHCEAFGAYTKFYCLHNKTHLTSKVLGEYEELLSPYGFIRTHKSHLVNKKYISFINHEGSAVLKDNSTVEISRRKKEDVMKKLK
jgi:two-component system LytT family response regulator